ncbi:MAG TPA: D-2-hydroxyacid dehydrogenase [Pyrinomonadaceae bacterium]|jgi:glycerate dehydrogenase
MHRIVFLDRDSLQADIRKPRFAHEWIDYGETRPEEVVERLRGAEIAVVNKVRLGEEELKQLPELRFVFVAATGMDNVDLDYCRRRGISVSNVRGYAEHTVPEHVLMLALALRRNLLAYRADLRRGEWQRAAHFCLFTHPIRDLHETTLGIVGYGSIGRGVARLASAFGMRVLVAEHKDAQETREGRTPFEEVIEESDILTLHAPLKPETRHLIGRDELSRMRPTALLINCARGGLVDEAALVEALKAGEIAGAGIDVLGSEPPREGNPLLDLQLPNLIVTPHVAWASLQAMQALADRLVDNIERLVNGKS